MEAVENVPGSGVVKAVCRGKWRGPDADVTLAKGFDCGSTRGGRAIRFTVFKKAEEK